jgi:hypothetical protein
MRNRSRIAAEPDPTKTGLGIAAPPMSSDTGAIRKKNRAAAALGRAGGKKGGRARAARLSPEERRASAQKAATMRWAKPPSELSAGDEPPRIVEGEILPPNGDLPPPSPFAKFRGQIDLSGNIVDVYVLDTGERVLSMRGAVKAMTGQDAGNLVEYIRHTGTKRVYKQGLSPGLD